MKTRNTKKENHGSALILVVVVTVLLSIVGVVFVMTTRMREMTTSNTADDRDLDMAVQSLVGQIRTILMQDLFGTKLDKKIIDGTGAGNEAYDASSADPWLADLEPKLIDERTASDPTDDWYQWERITNLYNAVLQPLQWDRILRDGQATWTLPEFGGVVANYQKFTTIVSGSEIPMTVDEIERLAADADGDGVADSRWIKVQNVSTSRGRPVFAAVRIVDNCAMLNLNNAFCFFQDPAFVQSPFIKDWYVNSIAFGANVSYGDDPVTAATERDYTDGGRYLSELNYYPFLRGSDLNFLFGWYNILVAKKVATIDGSGALTAPYPLPDVIHDTVLMKYENPGAAYSLFDIGDELEVRNRFVLTGKTESRFERHDVANYSLDAGGAVYGALEIPRENIVDPDGISNFTKWKWRIDSRNFDAWSGAFVGTWNGNILDNSYKYDRRHVSTFYSFDRNIRSGNYLLLDMALLSQPESIEEVFRPLRHQPIDLRMMTTPTEPNNIAVPDAVIDSVTLRPEHIISAHRNILHLLYTLREREFFAITKTGGPDPSALAKAAKKAAQQVANIIDYLDDDTTAQDGPFGTAASAMDPVYGSQVNANPTYIDKAIIDAMLTEVSGGVITPAWASYGSIDFGLAAGEVVYGYERQPFISELYTRVDDTGNVNSFAIEFYNPYPDALDISNWEVVLEAQNAPMGNYLQSYAFPAGLTIPVGGHLVLRSNPSIPSAGTPEESAGFGTQIKTAHAIRLLRTNPTNGSADLGVDSIRRDQILLMTSDVLDGLETHHVLKRDDRPGVFCDPNAIDHQSLALASGTINPGVMLTLGNSNGLTLDVPSYPLPVANTATPFDRFADFQRVAYIGNQGGDTNAETVSDIIAAASNESEIRFDAELDSDLLRYVCTLSRKDKGIPGRININTAPLHVIAAAIPPQLVMTGIPVSDPNYTDSLTLAADIVAGRPYQKLTELLKIPAMQEYTNAWAPNVGESIRDDLEERDWIFNRLANIFTVRSDTFTAYMLVRLGTDGPQRRMIAVFDRSNCWTATDKPKLVALHPVPDPR